MKKDTKKEITVNAPNKNSRILIFHLQNVKKQRPFIVQQYTTLSIAKTVTYSN